MIKESRKIEGGIVQVTTDDERFYINGEDHYPSVSWVCSKFPKGIAFYKWLASTGWDESKAIKENAGAKGTNIHKGVEQLLLGCVLEHDEYSVQEWEAINSFVEWYKTTNFKMLHTEKTIIDTDIGVGGTIDFIAIDEATGDLWVIDFKSSQYVWKEYELQISVYGEMVQKLYPQHEIRLGVLQLGYSRNKKKYKLTEVKNQYKLFKSVYQIWEDEHGKDKPKQYLLPSQLSL
jgi:hypothetical protein